MDNVVLLRPLLVNGILDTSLQTKPIDFKSWISSGKYLINDINSSKSFELDINDEYHFVEMLAFDCNRMATAAFETMSSIAPNTKIPKSFGWIAIQAYYAAFFAAHSIMRSFGFICSQLEKGHIDIINDYASILAKPNSLKADGGYYRASYDNKTRILKVKKMDNTHEDTWVTFKECLKYLSDNVLTVSGLTNKKQALSAQLDDLIVNLQHGGQYVNGSFLSKFRNAVNYRQEYQAWHPYGKNSLNSQTIMELMNEWKTCPIPSPAQWKNSPEAYDFFTCCLKTVNFSYHLILLIIDNSSNKKNVFKQWTNTFLQIQNT